MTVRSPYGAVEQAARNMRLNEKEKIKTREN